MKLRAGFVSNSSSSSFVLAIPPNFDVTKHPEFDEILDEFMQHVWDDLIELIGDDFESEENKPKVIQKLVEAIKLMTDQSCGQLGDLDDYNDRAIWGVLTGIPYDDPMRLHDFDAASGDPQWYNVLSNSGMKSIQKIVEHDGIIPKENTDEV